MRKTAFIIVVVAFVFAALCFFVVVPVANALSFPDEIRITRYEYQNQIAIQERFITGRTNYCATVSDTEFKYIDLKLFGFIPIKRVKVEVMAIDELLAGGVPIGFVVKSQGVIVVEPAPRHGFVKGDIITHLNGEEIASIQDFNNYVNALGGQQAINVKFIRGGRNMVATINVNPDETKLGLWLKDESIGIGTLTYINPKNNNFAALAHQYTDYQTGADIMIRGGDVYRINILGIDKSKGRNVGKYNSTLRQGTDRKHGNLLSGNQCGVFGVLFEDSELLRESMVKYPIASRFSVKPGKAKLRTSIDGVSVQEYDIEIVKTNYQTKKDIKSMIVRITDRELFSKTGGIIHGMSGSPIIQNGKMVGALTHVITSDTSKGYAIYIDFIVP